MRTHQLHVCLFQYFSIPFFSWGGSELFCLTDSLPTTVGRVTWLNCHLVYHISVSHDVKIVLLLLLHDYKRTATNKLSSCCLCPLCGRRQSTVDKLIKKTNLALVVGSSSWREQFVSAVTVSAGEFLICPSR